MEASNEQKMREAVKAVVDVGYPHNFQREAPHIRGYCYDITRAMEKCFAALAAPPRACDLMPEEELSKVVSKGIMESVTARPEFNFEGIKALVEVVSAAAIKCAYDTQLVSSEKGGYDGSK